MGSPAHAATSWASQQATLKATFDNLVTADLLVGLIVNAQDPDPEFEAFFVAISLQLGTSPVPTYGVDRINLARTVAKFIANHPGKPSGLVKVDEKHAKQAWRDTTGYVTFYNAFADVYLDWLYKHASAELKVSAAERYVEQHHGARRTNDFWTFDEVARIPSNLWNKLKP